MGELLPNVKSISPEKKEGWTAKTLCQKAEQYFNQCDSRTKTVYTQDGAFEEDNPAPYTVEGLCNFLGIVQSTFWKWRNSDNIELAEAAEMLHQKIMENRLVGALDGRQNPAFARFVLLNNDREHYREKVEVEAGVSAEVASIFNLIHSAGKELVDAAETENE